MSYSVKLSREDLKILQDLNENTLFRLESKWEYTLIHVKDTVKMKWKNYGYVKYLLGNYECEEKWRGRYH